MGSPGGVALTLCLGAQPARFGMTDLQSKRSTELAGAQGSSQVLQVMGLRFASFQIPSPPEDIFGSLASEKAKGSASGERTSGRAGRGSIARALTVPVGSRPSHANRGCPFRQGSVRR